MHTKLSARTTGLRIVVFALVAALLAGVMALLACAPAAPAGQSEAPEAIPTIPYLGTPPTEEEQATWRARPRPTPYPPGYVKPTDPPTFTPVPTFPREWETDAATPQLSSASSKSAQTALVSELREFIAKGNFDAVARVRVASHRDVMVPDGSGGTILCRRQTLGVISTYQGNLPSDLDIITAPSDRTNLHLDANSEYIMFLHKWYILKGTYPPDGYRHEYTKSELDAFGGEAFVYNHLPLWVIDANIAHRVPSAKVSGLEPIGSHLGAARHGSQHLPLPALEHAINIYTSSAQYSQSGPNDGFVTATPTPDPETRVTKLIENQAKYDGVARVRVRSHTDMGSNNLRDEPNAVGDAQVSGEGNPPIHQKFT